LRGILREQRDEKAQLVQLQLQNLNTSFWMILKLLEDSWDCYVNHYEGTAWPVLEYIDVAKYWEAWVGTRR
jgi:hypothetical protein